jgi:hypothetical protein
MTTIAVLKPACLLALAVALTSPLAATKADVDEAMSRDGLQKISVKGLDLAYARPGASLAAYKRVKLDPVEVEFDKSWDPAKTGSRIKLSSAERDNIKAGVAKLVQEEFAKALQKGGAYQIATDAAPTCCASRPASSTSTSTRPAAAVPDDRAPTSRRPAR